MTAIDTEALLQQLEAHIANRYGTITGPFARPCTQCNDHFIPNEGASETVCHDCGGDHQ